MKKIEEINMSKKLKTKLETKEDLLARIAEKFKEKYFVSGDYEKAEKYALIESHWQELARINKRNSKADRTL